MRQKATTALLGIALLAITFHPVQADQSAYYISPLKTEQTYTARQETVTGSIKVYSSSSETVKIRVTPKTWTMAPNGSLLVGTSDATAYPVADNMRLSPDEFDLRPHQTQLVRYAFRLPADQPTQEFHIQLAFEQIMVPNPQAATGPLESAIHIINNFATTLYIYPSNAAPQTAITAYTPQYQSDKNQLMLDATVANTGNEHARFKTKLILSQKSATGVLMPVQVLQPTGDTTLVVLPGKERVLHQILPLNALKPLPAGDYQAELQLSDERAKQPALSAVQPLTVP